jgi:hypothetical protein
MFVNAFSVSSVRCQSFLCVLIFRILPFHREQKSQIPEFTHIFAGCERSDAASRGMSLKENTADKPPGLGGCGGRKAISAEAEKQSPEAMQERSLMLLRKELKM